MGLKQVLARGYWAVSRWKYRIEAPPAENAGIMIGAPHTSNWDFVMMLAISWRSGIRVKFLGKHQMFKKPFGPLVRALGGIAVDRTDPSRVVGEILARIDSGERFYLVITPEGTRTRQDYWRSGFYRIARAADLPITLAYVNRTTMTAGLGPTFRLTGDVSEDMARIRSFYDGKPGIRPRLGNVPRLREEDDDG